MNRRNALKILIRISFFATLLSALALVACARAAPAVMEVVKTVEVEKEVIKVVEVARDDEAYRDSVEPVAAEELLPQDSPQLTERVIIREGRIQIEVEDTLSAKASIQAMIAEMAEEGAFVVSSNEYGSTGKRSPYINMSIRVPATRFDEVMNRLAEMAVEVGERNETAQDVTEEYVDLKSRLESMEAARDRLLEIMTDADTTEDLLRAEQQLTQREAEIESLKGRLQYLTQAARLSRIEITLTPHILSQPVESGWRPAETARQAIDSLLHSARGFGDFLIYFAIATLPWLIAIGLVVYGAVRLIRRRRPKSAKREEEARTQQS